MEKKIICPSCKTGYMDKKEFEGITIDKCGNCGGIYLDCGELEILKTKFDTSITGSGSSDMLVGGIIGGLLF